MRLTPLAASLPATVPFVGPETQERALGRPFLARIGANESVFGPSPRAIAAMAEAAADAWRYGDPELFELKAALATHHGVRPENVTVGEGIDGLLGNLVRLLVAPGTPVVTSAGAYPPSTTTCRLRRHARHRPLPRRRRGPRGAAPRRPQGRAPLLYLANPDNPMGSWHQGARIAELIARLPGGAPPLPRRGLRRLRPRRRPSAARRERAAGDPHAHLLQGARDGRRTHRLRPRPPRAHRRLRPRTQPLRRQRHRDGRRDCGARGRRLARPARGRP